MEHPGSQWEAGVFSMVLWGFYQLRFSLRLVR